MASYRQNYQDAYLAAITGLAGAGTEQTEHYIIERADRVAHSIALKYAERMDNFYNSIGEDTNE